MLGSVIILFFAASFTHSAIIRCLRFSLSTMELHLTIYDKVPTD